MFWNKSRAYFFFSSIQNIKTNCFIFLKFFPIIFLWWKIYLFPFILNYKRFLLLLFCFSSNQENLYMRHHDSDLFYDIYNIITKQSWANPLTLINSKLFWYVFVSEWKSSIITSCASSWFPCYHFLNALNALHHYVWKK